MFFVFSLIVNFITDTILKVDSLTLHPAIVELKKEKKKKLMFINQNRHSVPKTNQTVTMTFVKCRAPLLVSNNITFKHVCYTHTLCSGNYKI